MLNSRIKHVLHCCLFASVILLFQLHFTNRSDFDFDPTERYGYFGATFLYVLRLLVFLPFPQILLNFLGLVLYNAFPDKVILKGSPLLAPFVCVRVVTRGDYPELVRSNVYRNLSKCIDAGLEHFMIEVVTDKPINLTKDRRVVETIVPDTYKPKSGALFKSRALQYALEESMNSLAPTDWIVHLDEETLVTENSIRGILNFILDGKHSFGQGVITYANEEVVNWITTLADSFRVADDMGKLRFQLAALHKPLFNWKGSYVVAQVQAERDVGFDNGPDGSVAEDCYFAMKAFSQGYSFNFIEGEMWEKSPFTIWDFIQQRKRWMQGILLVVHSKMIPIKYKFMLGVSCYGWLTLPLSTLNIVLASSYPIPCPHFMDILCAFVGSVSIYMYIFGVIKSFSLYRFGVVKFSLCAIGALLTIPINVAIENIAVLWGLFGQKYRFYVVMKEIKQVSVV